MDPLHGTEQQQGDHTERSAPEQDRQRRQDRPTPPTREQRSHEEKGRAPGNDSRDQVHALKIERGGYLREVQPHVVSMRGRCVVTP